MERHRALYEVVFDMCETLASNEATRPLLTSSIANQKGSLHSLLLRVKTQAEKLQQRARSFVLAAQKEEERDKKMFTASVTTNITSNSN